jgi:hypothetical protein
LAALWIQPDSNPPMYALLLRSWYDLFGTSDFAGRMFSVVASLAAIAALFDLACVLANPTVALWSAALMAVSVAQVIYAQEQRNYTLLMAEGLWACDLLARLDRDGASRWRAIGLFALASATLMTHYFAILAVIGLGCYALFHMRGRAKRQAALALAAAGAAFCLLCVPVYLASAHVVNTSLTNWLVDADPHHFLATFRRIAMLPIGYLFHDPQQGFDSVGPLAAVLLILPAAMAWKNPRLLLPAFWMWGIIALVTLNDLVTHRRALDHVRYTLAASPMVFFFLARASMSDVPGLRGWLKWLPKIIPGVAVAGCLLALRIAYARSQFERGEFNLLGDDLRGKLAAGDVLVVASDSKADTDDAGALYVGVCHYDAPIPCPVVILRQPADDAMRKRIDAGNRVWLVLNFGMADPSKIVGPCEVLKRYSRRFFAGTLYEVKLLPADASKQAASRF